MIDTKFTFVAICREHNHEHTQDDGMVFLAKDKALPKTLRHYLSICQSMGADARQIQAVKALIKRVDQYQLDHPNQVKVADVDDTEIGRAIAHG